ncbi:undecaprenyl-phosphate mannosyltransferase [bacterium BMS3Abin05]|nr:undecaprenyl-phosphate mannosyltransferase [bacterium BMS3Abin05]GBE26185.1 undecaprenyl-phosphate mannosyltransferase [bacterium BMS3Bbin03]
MEFDASFPFYKWKVQKIAEINKILGDKRTLVIIPTYNEVQNIQLICQTVLDLKITGLSILVVDDNSPDGTADRVRQLQKTQSNIQLIVREKKLGLGSAYVRGFKFAIREKFDYIFEMDADFSHDPREIPNFLHALQDCDLVIGSRYIQGVNVINWPLSRLMLSYFANLYTQLITGLPIKDSTSGYKCFRRQVLEKINLDKITSDGYAFQIEMDFKAWKLGFRLKEIPIIFVDRFIGHSKMSKQIVREAAWVVWKLKYLSLFAKVE